MNRAGRPTPSSASTGAPAGEVTIRPIRDSFFGSEVDAAVALYNRAHEGMHGFFPLTAHRFRRRVLESPHFQPDLFLLAETGGRPVGLVHAAALGAPCHEDGGVVELLAVDPDHRGRGIGGLLLDAALGRLARHRPPVIDGGGAFPFSPFYATLLDGSERSGVPADNAPALRLFLRRGFRAVRESLIMRADLAGLAPAAAHDAGLSIRQRHPEGTWLDHVFRGWELFDSSLTDGRRLRSRAIFGRMPDLSAREGRTLFAVFGVHTPEEQRGRGYATEHFRRLLPHLKSRGADLAELHVYADNAPAVRLYRSAGFREIHRTVMLRRRGA